MYSVVKGRVILSDSLSECIVYLFDVIQVMHAFSCMGGRDGREEGREGWSGFGIVRYDGLSNAVIHFVTSSSMLS